MTIEPSSCYGCGQITELPVTACPNCGKRLQTANQARIRGWLMLALGLFLVGLMGTITYNIGPAILQPGVAGNGTRFTGTAQQGLVILGLFGAVIVFGLSSIINGLWHIITGRRSRWITIAMLGLYFVLIAVGEIVQNALGD